MLGEGVEASFSADVEEVAEVAAASVDHELVGKVVDPGVNTAWEVTVP